MAISMRSDNLTNLLIKLNDGGKNWGFVPFLYMFAQYQTFLMVPKGVSEHYT